MIQLHLTAPSHLNLKRTELFDRRETLVREFAEAATMLKKPKSHKRLKRLCTDICVTNEFIDTLDKIAEETTPARASASSTRRFVVSSLLLYESFKKLTADEAEQLFYLTGVETDGKFVLNQICELEHESRTAFGVKADIRSTHNLLIRFERFRHRFLAHFHSHPGNGPESTHPSGLDERLQSKLENAGHIAVAAIFSRDGFVRFFRLDQNFEIEIYGEGVTQHAPNVFRLTDLA